MLSSVRAQKALEIMQILDEVKRADPRLSTILLTEEKHFSDFSITLKILHML
jgi:hypothetical protein